MKQQTKPTQEQIARAKDEIIKNLAHAIQNTTNDDWLLVINRANDVLGIAKQLMEARDQYVCKQCGTKHPTKPLLNIIHGEPLCPDCDGYSGDGIYQ